MRPVKLEERRVYSMRDNHYTIRWDAIEAQQIGARSLRDRDQPPRTMRRSPEQQSPKRKIEPAKMLRKAFVLEIVKGRHARARGQNRRGEAGVEQDVEPVTRRFERQYDLLPQDSSGTETREHRL